MIVVSRAVDVEAGTVTYTLTDQGYDHEYQGRPCHAVEMDGADGDQLKHYLRMLGYQHIGCETQTWPPAHREFWAKPELPPAEGSQSP